MPSPDSIFADLHTIDDPEMPISTAFGELLDEMCKVYRTEPGAKW